MNDQVVSYITDFTQAGCAFLAFFIILPASSASAQQLKPAWRAWVWPVAFIAFATSSLSAGCGLLLKLNPLQMFQLFRDLLFSLGITLIVLNSIYRLLVRRTAPYFAPFVWLGFLVFAFSIIALSRSYTLEFLMFEFICSAILIAIYGTIYSLEKERASDAIPTLTAACLIILSGIISSVNLKLEVGPLSITQVILTHLLQVLALFFFLTAANNGYVIKYALHRRQQRESEQVLIEVK